MRALLIAAGGCLLALLLALGLGYLLMRGRHKDALPVASGGLQIEQGPSDSATPVTKTLRCFVSGQYAGMATVSECAAKNGVAAQALDTGLDPATGAAPGGSLAPPPPAPAPAPAPAEPAEQAEATPAAPTGECLRYAGEAWRSVSTGTTIAACAKALFDGRCVRPGEAQYGRWGSNTLRLVTGRIEMSPDNRNFHPLEAQNPDCSLPSG